MAIEKHCLKVSEMDTELSKSKDSMSSDEDEFSKSVDSDEDDEEFNDCDSGAGSDDFDYLELGGSGEEFIQVGDQTCSIPTDVYDLPGLGDILSMDVWNDVLTEEERFSLTNYLPDMDQEMFMRTLKELFTGCNMHFGNPVDKLFKMLKGGLCEPRVALYRQGLNFFQNCKHYHLLRKYQNSMVTDLYLIRDAWASCRGYSIEEKIRVLNIIKSQKSLMHENMDELETASSEREESANGFRNKRLINREVGQKIGHYPGRKLSSSFDYSSHERQMALDTINYGRQNPKGTLKVTGSKKSTTKELAGRFAAHHGMEVKSGPYGIASAPPQQNMTSGYDSRVAVRIRDQARYDVDDNDDADEAMYEVAVQSDRNFPKTGQMNEPSRVKVSKISEDYKGDEYSDSFTSFPVSSKIDLCGYSRNTIVNQLSDIEVLTAKPSSSRFHYGYAKTLKSPNNMQQINAEDHVKYNNIRTSNLLMKGSQIELSERGDAFWHRKTQDEPFKSDPPSSYHNSNVKNKKFKFEKSYPDVEVNDRSFVSVYRESEPEKKVISMQSGQRVVNSGKGQKMLLEGNRTDSDSSEQCGADDDDNPLMRSKWAFPGGTSGMKSVPFTKKGNFVEKETKNAGPLNGSPNSKMAFKQKDSIDNIGPLYNSMGKSMEGSFIRGPGRVTDINDEDDWRKRFKYESSSQMQREQGGTFSMSSLQPHPAGRTQKAETMHHSSVAVDDDDSLGGIFVKYKRTIGRMQKRGQNNETREASHCERPDMQLSECTSLMKQRKFKDDLMTNMAEPDGSDSCEKVASGLPFIEDTTMGDVHLESKPVKKPYTLITPTVLTGFSFSIIHLLSAVRTAMITMLPEDSLDMHKPHTNDGILNLGDEKDRKQEEIVGIHLNQTLDIKNSEQAMQVNVPCLTVENIVNRVRSNPGDPSILETQEPLQDLIRGVLKIFSSKTAPSGAKGWKTVVHYKKSTKTWSWAGPLPETYFNQESVEEVTSPEAWGLPRKMLVKLVDSFANWLKSSQETLRLIGSLPAPPPSLMQLNFDEKERFRDLRAQKSLNTISPCSDEVRSYFRKEEFLRYSIPDRAFSYTAVDGKKSIVAPLRRCGGKPTSKARDHFMLKRDRPAHVTILCLVRDAAARLPGSIGTRADVCTLIRDSQYVVEDVSDAQVNQVVSGALDRLHYERDPCVQFDGERKLWVYLHREREEEDFEDDGTSSTKKWKRPKKEAPESSELGAVTVAYSGTGEGDQTEFHLSSDLNVDSSLIEDDNRVDLLYYSNSHVEVNGQGLEQQGVMNQGQPVVWQAHGLNPVQENSLLCPENSTNRDLDDENFGR